MRGLAKWRRTARTPRIDPDPAFLAFLVEGGLAAWDRQLAFAELVGDRDWELDQDDRVLKLGEDLWLPASILGSTSDAGGTWLWAWANPSIEPNMCVDADRASALGGERGLAFLTEPEIDLDLVVDGHLVALAVSGALDCDAYYRCPYPGGAAYVTVKWSRVRVLDGSPGRRVGEVVERATVDMPSVVSRRSVEAYLASVGASASVDGQTIHVDDGPTLTFDEMGRLTLLEAQVEASG